MGGIKFTLYMLGFPDLGCEDLVRYRSWLHASWSLQHNLQYFSWSSKSQKMGNLYLCKQKTHKIFNVNVNINPSTWVDEHPI